MKSGFAVVLSKHRNMWTHFLLFFLSISSLTNFGASTPVISGDPQRSATDGGIVRNYGEMGVCENVLTGRQRCAMQSSDCEPSHIDGQLTLIGEKWYSAYQQKQRGFDPCTCKMTSIGTCLGGLSPGSTSANDRCSPQSNGFCHAGESFLDARSTNDGNTSCKCDEISYGACQDRSSNRNHFCAFSPKDCEDGMHVWIAPRDVAMVTGLVCTCENVRIGGCVGGFQGFNCAVTQDDCPWDQYFPPFSLKRVHGYTCNLCQGPQQQSTTKDELDELPQQELLPKRNLGMSTTGKALISVFFLISAISLTSLFVYRRRRIINHNKQSTGAACTRGQNSGDEKSTDTKVSDSEII